MEQALVDFIRQNKISTATRCLAAQEVQIDIASLCTHVDLARAIMRLAQRGGFEAARTLIDRLAWKTAPDEMEIPSALSAQLFEHAYEGACHPKKGGRKHVVDLFALLLALPDADEHRRGRLIALYQKYWASAVWYQTEVCERNGFRDLDDALRLEPMEEIRRCIGTTLPFTMLRELLVVAAVNDKYPALAADLLRMTLEVADWPITACLGSTVEVVFHDQLAVWFLSPAAKATFTDAAKYWLKRAVCDEPDDEEPSGSFVDD